MRLSFLVAVTSLFAVAAYGAPIASDTSIVLNARALDPQPALLLERDVVENSTPLRREEEGSPVQSWHSDVVENSTPVRREEEGSPVVYWRRDVVENSTPLRREEEGSPNQAWRRDVVENSTPLRRKVEGSPSQALRRGNEDPQFEKRETIAESDVSVGSR